MLHLVILVVVALEIDLECLALQKNICMSAKSSSQKFVRIPNEMPQTSNQNCNTMAPNICWPKIVRKKLDKAYLNQN